ncbi:ELWxxDGT repeat protein [Rubinisphaera margarita]|uniref:ELWxxDGT repeat protein n=1 Tax=Rubinisphaera margarita TaxID=2909586 RepID=UPI001EE8C42E|nr:ELWxxDGT repeat protein [Rubinisphaera margarita]MCG6158207.1 FG-GAP-like repeat-containing protein [Rubinisphaera margarita]
MLVNNWLNVLLKRTTSHFPHKRTSAGHQSSRRRRDARLQFAEPLEVRVLLSGDDDHGHHHTAGVDVLEGYYTWEEFLELESTEFAVPPGMPPAGEFQAQPDGGHEPDVLTIVLDFKDSDDPQSTDLFDNVVGEFDVTAYGFNSSDFGMIVDAIMEEVDDDFFHELIGTVANSSQQDLAIDFVVGDIGTLYAGASEYYYVQIGTGISGDHTNGGILGVAAASAVRDENGTANIYGLQNGAIVASIFTDVIQGMGGLTPSSALSSGNLEYTTHAITGTLSHEIAHTLSLSHINKAGSTQPTSGVSPLMGTGAIDLPNQDRITDREFSLSGIDGQNEDAPRNHVQQLVDAVGLHDAPNDPPTVALQNTTTSFPENTDTTNRLKVADIAVTDDDAGVNTLALSGADAGLFEIDGLELFLSAGTTLDYESQAAMDVTVTVDDTAVGDTPDDSVALTVTVTDVNETPSLTLNDYGVTLEDEQGVSQRTAVADVMVVDDALGANLLSLSGAHAALFELEDNVLFLVAGVDLRDYAGQTLSVDIDLDDQSVGGSPDASVNVSIDVEDVDVFITSRLLKDISDQRAVGGSNLREMGGQLFFTASISPYGTELWTSDGTIAGTTILKDILIGAGSSTPEDLTVVGDQLFFTAIDAENGRELWVTDGTSEGTVLVSDLTPGLQSTTLVESAVADGLLFFVDSLSNLWVSDGTEAGTTLVRNASDEQPVGPGELFSAGNRIFFQAAGTGTGDELWTSDGTAAGTYLVKDINAGGTASSPQEFAAVGNLVYFQANDGTNGAELWVSDGTAQGTTLLSDINPGPDGSTPSQLTVVGDEVYFQADDGVNGVELWVTDGTGVGTRLVKNIMAGGVSSSFESLAAFDGRLFFVTNDGINGSEIWSSDGTEPGTTLFADLNPGVASATPARLTVIGNRLYFQADDGSTGVELWSTDGTEIGTALVNDLNPGNGSSDPTSFTPVGERIYFSADDGDGDRLRYLDGETIEVVQTRLESSNPTDVVTFGDRFYFSAYDPVYGRELWGSDGTEAGTVLFKDINPGTGSSTPGNFEVVGDQLFFVANDSVRGEELWVSDGTSAGTQLVKDIRQDSASSTPRDLTAVGDLLFFEAYDSTAGYSLWVSDGTSAGTALVKDINASALTGTLNNFTVVGDLLYSQASDAATGTELWVSDGTSAGTVLVKDINSGSASSSPADLVAVGGQLFFSADDGSNGRELWVSDGTTEGTLLVRDIDAGADASNPSSLVALGGSVYFQANDGVNGTELWVSDGTLEGTQLLKDIRSGNESSTPEYLTLIGDQIYFSASDGVTGAELWVTDGTTGGTRLLKDVRLGAESSNPMSFTAFGDQLFFRVLEQEREFPQADSFQLWVTDGTATGTRLVDGLFEGAFGVDPQYLTPFESSLVFRAFSDESGYELWIADVNHTPVNTEPVSSDAIDSDNEFVLDLLTGTSDVDPGETLNVSNLQLISGDAKGVTVSSNSLTITPSAYASLPFGAAEVLSYSYRVVDRFGSRVNQTATITITGTDSPPQIALQNQMMSLAEDADTTARRKVADIVVTDDGGSPVLSLSGADATMFEIDGTELYLIAGAKLDYETKPSLEMTVQVDDPGVGGNPDGTATLTISVTDANDAPSVSLLNTVTILGEGTDMSSRLKVGDIVLNDDAQGLNVVSLSGADAAMFEIDGGELYLRAGSSLSKATNPQLAVTVQVDDAEVGSNPDGTVDLSIEINQTPGISLQNTVATLAEDTDTSGRIRIADILIDDDGYGTNILRLEGDDAGLFELDGTVLFLRAGTTLDYETNSELSLSVEIYDSTVGNGTSDLASLSISIANVNDPPRVALQNEVRTLPEDTSTSSRVKVADIVITDDALGTNTLKLTGIDQPLFEIVGSALYLKAGAVLDYETNPVLNITVQVDDATLGTGPDDDVSLEINVDDVLEGPPPIPVSSLLGFANGNWWLSSADANGDFTSAVSASGPASLFREAVQGDFNGDGVQDVAVWLLNGEWRVGLANGAGQFTFTTWTSWTHADIKEVHVGDFNDDGRDDIIGLFRSGDRGRWWVAQSDGSRFANRHWGDYGNYNGINTVLVGNFDGVKGDDLTVIATSGVVWMVKTSNTRFQYLNSHRWNLSNGFEFVQVGNFNGDHRDDVLAVFGTGVNRSVFVAKSIGPAMGFYSSKWSEWTVNQSLDAVVVGDFDGDGRSNVVALLNGTKLWYGASDGRRFEMRFWLDWSEVAGGIVDVAVGDINGDGLADILGRTSNGKWRTAESNGSSFADRYVIGWSASAIWKHVMIGNFTTPRPAAPESPSPPISDISVSPRSSPDDFAAFGDDEMLDLLYDRGQGGAF